jgi:general nucleoside transport system permease protein
VLGDWPRPLLILAMIVGGALAGLLWAVIPGVLRAYLRTNEILTSLMLNYVAGYFMYYLIYDSNSYWRDLTGASAKVFPTGKTLVPAASWPAIGIGSFNLPFGFVVGAVIAAGMLYTIRRTRYGFEMRVMGDAPPVASYAGMRTRRKIVSVMAVAGAVAGIGGASQIGDFGHVLDPRGLQQAQYGYTGIVVAALALYNPVAVVLVSVLLGGLTNAGFALQGPNFPTGLVGTMEGIIIFSVLGGEILARYRIALGAHLRPGRAGATTSPEPAALTPGGPAVALDGGTPAADGAATSAERVP